MNTIDISHSNEIYTVSQLNRSVRLLLEEKFAILWVEGEISNFVAPHSGHWYFSLKDANAQIRCAMFRSQNRDVGFTPQDGTQVLLKARVSLYEGRGDFQLLVDHLEEAGAGKLRQAFELLKKQLSEAGLFDPAHKKNIPALPQTIGIITSATGAAIRDILHVIKRRFPCASIIIYPTLVQGDQAAPNIVNALNTANQRKECDVLILARGGGSLEDLWPFNESSVAYAIYESEIPIVTGIGHEIDFTIADFVADIRAPTPSAAAELVTPDSAELLETLGHYQQHLTRQIKQKLAYFQQNLIWVEKHLQQQHPKRLLTEQHQRLDHYEQALIRAQTRLITQYQQKLANAAAKLDVLSPLATLSRGFAIVTDVKNQRILRDASETETGDRLEIKLMRGKLNCTVM